MTHRFSFSLVLLLVLAPAAAHAQTPFTVTVEAKSADHPYNGMGHPDGFVIDGEEANELTLVRGEMYTFQMDGVPAFHPFYLSTSEAGAGAEPYTDGVTGTGATGSDVLTFVVPMDAPDLLWYQCQNHQFMGWRITITNPVGNEDDAQPLALELGAAFPNPFAERTKFTLRLAEPQDVAVGVFDVAGRRVATLHDGLLSSGREHVFTFDANGLADGTYVVRVRAGERTAERRVTLVR